MNRSIISAVLLAAGFGVSAAARTIDFEKDSVGKPPAGFSFALTGGGKPGVWVVRRDEKFPDRGNVLAQTDADSTSYRFPVATVDNITAKDVDLSVRFRPVSGREDQGAGLVWRYNDENNYYIVRANALEGNVVLYKVQNGRRTDLPVRGAGRTYGKKADVPSGRWGQLAVSVRGSMFQVSLNGQKLYEVEDYTFSDGGKIGLWTKADSVIYFDDLMVDDLSGPGGSAGLGTILAQRLVDELAQKHPELVRIGLHVTPPGSSENIIIASNVPAKIGQKSDPEDLEAIVTGRPVVLKEGENFDVTLRLHDRTGKIIGAIGLTLKPSGGQQDDATKRARAIASELEKRTLSKDRLFGS